MLPSCAVGVLDPSSRRWECIVLASNLVSLTVLIFSAQTVKFEDFEGPKSSYFCVPPVICCDWVLP